MHFVVIDTIALSLHQLLYVVSMVIIESLWLSIVLHYRPFFDASKGPPNVAFYVACVELSFRIWYLPYSSY